MPPTGLRDEWADGLTNFIPCAISMRIADVIRSSWRQRMQSAAATAAAQAGPPQTPQRSIIFQDAPLAGYDIIHHEHLLLIEKHAVWQGNRM